MAAILAGSLWGFLHGAPPPLIPNSHHILDDTHWGLDLVSPHYHWQIGASLSNEVLNPFIWVPRDHSFMSVLLGLIGPTTKVSLPKAHKAYDLKLIPPRVLGYSTHVNPLRT